MTTRIIPVDIFDIIVFGATGDLAQRKLIPALFHRDEQGQLPAEARIIGTSRRDMSDDEFKAFAMAALESFVDEKLRTPETMVRFLARLSYIAAEASKDDGWPKLETKLKDFADRTRIFYLAVGPDLFGPICERLGNHNLVTPLTRVVIEKPVGKSGASAKALNEAIGKVFREPAIYRIDHYLGKETVQNLMALRFANAFFEPVWNSAHIDHVQITVAETLGVEGRAGYYDTAGALRDMVQNHMLQLLCLVAMEPPTSMEANAVRDEKLKVLKSLKPITAANIDQHVVGEGGWQENQIGALFAQLPEQIGKADVVTNRATDRDVARLISDDLVARPISVAFLISGAIRRHDVEQMHLPVTREFRAVRIEHHRGVEQLLRPLLDDRAAVNMHFMFPRGLPHEFVSFAARFVGTLRWQKLRVGVAHRAVAAKGVPDFGQ